MRNFSQVNRNGYNAVHVSGILYDIKNFSMRPDRNGNERINCTLAVATDSNLSTIVNVRFSFVGQKWSTKPDAKDNPAFETLNQIAEKNLTVQNVGADNAIRVRIDGNLAKNDFVNTNTKEMVEATVIEGTFIHTDNVRDFEATFQADMVITSYSEQEGKDGTSYGTIGGYIFNFRNDFLPVRFNVPSTVEGAMEYFASENISNSNPLAVNLSGKVNTTTVQSTVECAFGVRATSRSLTTWDVQTAIPYDVDSWMTVEEIKEGLQERENHLAEVRQRFEERQAVNSQAATTVTNLGVAANESVAYKEDMIF